ncbi:hypothetical protein [Methanobrevibacter olleyae]|uniref:hypothetical protein n=1 Tax=Methanobrevibacter olleyae TaxID=294671 RepID=UPI000B0B97FB|nr:hypothetical protein [Methanobrevibacter olleyae]
MSRGSRLFTGGHRHHRHHGHLLGRHLLGDVILGALAVKGLTSTLKDKEIENK